MISFGAIRKTEEYVDFKRTNIKEQIEDILDDPNIYQTLEIQNNDDQKTLEENLLDYISQDIDKNNNKKNITLSGIKITESKDFILIGYFLDKQEELYGKSDEDIKLIKEQFDKKELNVFASQLMGTDVISDLYIVKYNLKYKVQNKNIETSKIMTKFSNFELIHYLRHIYVKTGFILDTNGSIKTYEYIENPLELLITTDKNWMENYRTHEYEIYNRVMIVIVNIKEKDVFNLNASLLTGIKTNGCVFVGMYEKSLDNNSKYVGTSIDIMKKIIKVRGDDQQKTENFSIFDNSREYINFEYLIEQEEIQSKKQKYNSDQLLNNDV
jgi:hypothetical protein